MFLPSQFFLRALPPQIDRASAIRKDIDPARAATRLAYFALIRQADLDPLFDYARQVASPQIGLVLGA
jgi:hypothetical protein